MSNNPNTSDKKEKEKDKEKPSQFGQKGPEAVEKIKRRSFLYRQKKKDKNKKHKKKKNHRKKDHKKKHKKRKRRRRTKKMARVPLRFYTFGQGQAPPLNIEQEVHVRALPPIPEPIDESSSDDETGLPTWTRYEQGDPIPSSEKQRAFEQREVFGRDGRVKQTYYQVNPPVPRKRKRSSAVETERKQQIVYNIRMEHPTVSFNDSTALLHFLMSEDGERFAHRHGWKFPWDEGYKKDEGFPVNDDSSSVHLSEPSSEEEK